MKKLKRSIISLIMCVAMVSTLCVPAFATVADDSGETVYFGNIEYTMFMEENDSSRTVSLIGEEKSYRVVYDMEDNNISVYVDESIASPTAQSTNVETPPYKVIDLNGYNPEPMPQKSSLTFYASDTVEGAYFYVHWDDDSYELLCNRNPKAYTEADPPVTIRDRCKNYYTNLKQLDKNLVSLVDYIEAAAADHAIPHFSLSLIQAICTIFNDSATDEEDVEAYETIATAAVTAYTGWKWLPDLLSFADYCFKQACVKENVDQLIKIYTYVYNWYN